MEFVEYILNPKPITFISTLHTVALELLNCEIVSFNETHYIFDKKYQVCRTIQAK